MRERVAALTGHVKPVAESTLYPAIKRLEKAGPPEPAGHARGGSPARPHADHRGRAELLERRMAFPPQPSSFFSEGDRPLRAEEVEDPFRRGTLTIARATSQAELSWPRRTPDTLRAANDD
ncbi:PadR family transcriptional regulator [Streptomyces malaysiensis subsp. malaysiensis]|nr:MULTISPECIES: hypothetical protein [Streptomyces]UHH22159.1 hypothetical protein LUV23_41165 [Streptomyces sp. HNM0561]